MEPRSSGIKTASYDRELTGAVDECALYAGLGVGFVKDLPPAGVLVERLWRECQAGK
jgi:hypothetical protein